LSVNPTLQDLLDVQAHFGLPSPALVEKDIQVAKALAAIAVLDTGPLRLVFGGGTALGRAYRLIHRMSEDIDLKIVSPEPPKRADLRQLRHAITEALLAAGFQFNPEDPEHRHSRNESRYTIYRLPYAAVTEGQGILRPAIQIETAVWPLRKPSVELSVRSFHAEAFQQPPEVARIACVSILETAAEKFVALTRRIATEKDQPDDQRDTTLARHIYDLHVIKSHYELDEVAALIPAIIKTDVDAYGNQFSPYRDDPMGETLKAIDALASDPVYARTYADFQRRMVYGEKIEYGDAIQTLITISSKVDR
jgi:predicted nucleotidyltransferase component of viral defense system